MGHRSDTQENVVDIQYLSKVIEWNQQLLDKLNYNYGNKERSA